MKKEDARGRKKNEDMQSYVGRDFAAGASGDEGDDSPVPVSDGGFKRVVVDCVLAAGDVRTGEHVPDSDEKRTDSACERVADQPGRIAADCAEAA